MEWRDTAILGSFAYTTVAFGWLWRVVKQFIGNHMADMEKRVKALEERE